MMRFKTPSTSVDRSWPGDAGSAPTISFNTCTECSWGSKASNFGDKGVA
jgi:hypothetical protein